MNDLTLRQRMEDEMRLLGYGLSAHPLDFCDDTGTTPASEMHRIPGRRARMIGWMIAGKIVTTRGEQRRPMKFLSFEDRTGTFEVTLFPDVYERLAADIQGPGPWLVEGRIEDDRGALSLVADRVEPAPVRAAPA